MTASSRTLATSSTKCRPVCSLRWTVRVAPGNTPVLLTSSGSVSSLPPFILKAAVAPPLRILVLVEFTNTSSCWRFHQFGALRRSRSCSRNSYLTASKWHLLRFRMISQIVLNESYGKNPNHQRLSQANSFASHGIYRVNDPRLTRVPLCPDAFSDCLPQPRN